MAPIPSSHVPKGTGHGVDLRYFKSASHSPKTFGAMLYLFFTADVSGRRSPGDGGDGVSRGLAGQSDLLF